MNKEFVLFHLREAAEQLARTVQEVESDPEFDSGQLFLAAQHWYHHLNSAWNGQDIHELKEINMTDARWNRLGRFPADFPLMSV